jgi:hypothetical protein
MNNLTTFGKIGHVLQWLMLPAVLALVCSHGGWAGAAFGALCALVILDQQAELQRNSVSIDRLLERLKAANKPRKEHHDPNH